MATQSNGESNVKTNIPEWLKSDLFEDMLNASVSNYKRIKSFNAESGSVVGENYATIMLRVEIDVELKDGTIKSLSYMLKLPHQGEMYLKMLEKNNIFDSEFCMYRDTVPEFEQLYKDAGVEIKFGAQCYEINVPSYYVLLEDLRPKGFKIANRLEGLDTMHTESVLRKLAQWHAASAVRVDTKGLYSDQLSSGFFKDDSREMMEEVGKSMGQQFLKCCQTYKGHEGYIDQIKTLQTNLTDTIMLLRVINPDEFNVLNHGDAWLNNIMFKHDDNGNILETNLVDYQIPKYGPPAQDLLYFLISSTRLEDKLTKFDYYIKYYHDHLVEHLKILNYKKKIPTLREIHISLFKYGIWGYWVATGVMGVVLLDPTESANMENFLANSEEAADFKNLMYGNPRYRKHIEAILPWLQNRGILE